MTTENKSNKRAENKALLNPGKDHPGITINRLGTTIKLVPVAYERGEGKFYLGLGSDTDSSVVSEYLVKSEEVRKDDKLASQLWENRLRSMFNAVIFKQAYRDAVINIPANTEKPNWELITKDIEAWLDAEAKGESKEREKTSAYYRKLELEKLSQLAALAKSLGGPDKAKVDAKYLALRTEVIEVQKLRKAKEAAEAEAKAKQEKELESLLGDIDLSEETITGEDSNEDN